MSSVQKRIKYFRPSYLFLNLDMMSVLLFLFLQQEIAGEVLMTIAQAFEITYQKVMMARVGRKGRPEEEDKRQS